METPSHIFAQNTPTTRPLNGHDQNELVEGQSQFHAEVDRITYRNEDNGWTVLKVRNVENGELITVTGTLPPIQDGEHLQLVGTWSSHPTFGKQFKAVRAVPTRPTTRQGIIRYLCSGMIKGIGEKTAERIVGHFGLDTFKILDENPGCLLQVPTLKKKKAKDIIDSWKAQKSVADVMMFLINHGVSTTYAQKILKLYGDNAIEVISANPYQLSTDIQGIGFIKADTIARSIGIALDSPERVRAAIIYFFQQSEDRGHCYLTSKQICESLMGILNIELSKLVSEVPKQIDLLNQAGSLVTENTKSSNDESDFTHWRPELIGAEFSVVDALTKLLSMPVQFDQERINQWIEKYNQVSTSPLSTSQAIAVETAVKSRVFVLTGGPGVGKTTTANAIIRLFKAMGRTVLLAAPTGRAAQRLSEVSAEKAKTIHRLLEWQPQEGAFARNETNPLAADVIVCDEASMLDIRLAESLCCALSSNCQLILIGDVDQLPSVGPGNVLRDLLQSGRIPSVTLNEIFRQAASSNIIRYAHAINSGETPTFNADGPSDCQFIEVDSTDDIRAVMKKLLTDVLPLKYQFDPKRDVQILTPMNRGDLGTQILNEELQDLLNPMEASHLKSGDEKSKKHRRGFRSGDKVIQMTNNYELLVYNGDIGFVQAANVDGGQVIVQFADDRVITYSEEQADDLRLAYAITIHKSQGSEFPVVILPSSMAHYVMLQRNLVYTGLTRARKLAIFIGAKKALTHAIKNNISIHRQTHLADRLKRSIKAL
ncbi:MAG: ATP-dependent RecD-like DNA helicase [Proteobacteria bacterium]|nr:ATP-dependent RecD-like DNA helicase [Pseudomonadota bacterium]